jgi:hypothetical protein
MQETKRSHRQTKGIISFTILLLLLSCCSELGTLPTEDLAGKVAVRALTPILGKYYDSLAPITPPSRTLFPEQKELPNTSAEKIGQYKITRGGVFLLTPGSYQFPVMTYCMKLSGSSPSAHRYTLAALMGTRASMIRDLNMRARRPLRFSWSEIQHLSWELQAGVRFDEMDPKSQMIGSTLIPDHISDLKASSYQKFINQWNQVAKLSSGIPSFESASEEFLNSLGDLGKELAALRAAHQKLVEIGTDYRTFERNILLPGRSGSVGTSKNVPWSEISPRVFARFITTGQFQQPGVIEINVLPKVADLRSQFAKDRFVSLSSLNGGFLLPTNAFADSTSEEILFDLGKLVADPGASNIQPLSFTPLEGAAAIPLIAVSDPRVVSAFLVALIASEFTDWEAVGKATQQWGASTQVNVEGLIDKLRKMLSKEFGPKPGQVVLPPSVPQAYPGLTPTRSKTIMAGGKKRARWIDSDGNIYEWDYQHGRLEKYDRRGNHQGEFDPKTGKQTKPRNPKYKVEP